MPATVESANDFRRRWRAQTLPLLRGVVLDVGAGRGQSAEHLVDEVEWIALEPRRPSRTLTDIVERRGHALVLQAPAEDMPLPDASVDVAVCSSVLCSVRSPERAVAEILRVLRPEGLLVFAEHVGSPARTWSHAAQRAYRPFGRVFDAGCDPSRDLESVLRGAGFAELTIHHHVHPAGLGLNTPVIHGEAVR